jgi:hypothetical protein
MSRIILFLVLVGLSNADLQVDNEQYDLEYTIDAQEKYEKLTTINLKTLKQNQNQFLALQTAAFAPNAPLNTNSLGYFTEIYSENLHDAIRKQLFALLNVAEATTIIKFRLCKSNQCTVSTFLNFDQFMGSNNIEMNLTMHLNLNSNLINSITVKLVSNSDGIDPSKSIQLTLNANVVNIRQAQLPDTQTYIEKVKREMASKKDEAQANNKSFLQKYWYYIVPFVVIMFISSFVNPEAAAGGS